MTKKTRGKEYYDNKKEELKKKLDQVLTKTLVSKEEMDKLASHYRITGLYNYSFYNTITIMVQGGTIAQSFHGWKKLKRSVKKGVHSKISIYRPFFKKVKDEKTGEEKQKLVGFGLSPVFDIEQTEGEDLKYDHNSQDNIDCSYEGMKAAAVSEWKLEVVEAVTGKARGFTDGKKITISSMSNNTDKVKTLIHEIAHCRMEHVGNSKTSGAKEVEAEGAAYLAMSYVGIDYALSEAYINGWKSKDTNVDRKLIIKVADEIIKKLFSRKEIKKAA